jgi:hypothetical protein
MQLPMATVKKNALYRYVSGKKNSMTSLLQLPNMEKYANLV